MLFALTTIVVTAAALRAGYVIGKKQGIRLEQSRRTWYTRPHTEETLKQYPLPEDQPPAPPATVQEALIGRHDLPNSGVRWS